jgi:hypothetical protein
MRRDVVDFIENNEKLFFGWWNVLDESHGATRIRRTWLWQEVVEMDESEEETEDD